MTWNGSTFFVPESTAYAYEGGMGYPQTLEVRGDRERNVSSHCYYITYHIVPYHV